LSLGNIFLQFIKKGVLKTILWLVVFLILSFTLLVSAIQVPYIQTKVVTKITHYLSEKTGFPVQVGFVNIRWFDTVLLEDVIVKDPLGNIMIGVEELSLNFKLFSLVTQGNINIEQAKIIKADVNIIRNTEDDGLNIMLFVENIAKLVPAQPPSEGPSTVFNIDNVLVFNSHFSLSDPTEDSLSYGFDYYHFDVNNINGVVNNLRIASDTFEIDVKKLVAHDPASNLNIKSASLFFRICSKSMEFSKVNVKTGRSWLRESVIFKYNQVTDLLHFNDSIHISANLKNSIIYTQDLALFAPPLKDYFDFYKITGNFEGKVRKFRMSNCRLEHGNNSFMEGNISFDGLPNIMETFIELRLKSSLMDLSDLRRYLPSDSYEGIEKFGQIRYNGSFTGFPLDFVANGSFETSMGRVVSDINLKIDDQTKKSAYSGNLATYNFDLGRLLGMPDILQTIDMKGDVVGQGFSLEDAELTLNAKIKSLGIKKYNYKNISTNAKLSQKQFNGSLNINDPNLEFKSFGTIDLREEYSKVKIKGVVDTIHFKPLNLLPNDLFVKSEIEIDFTGLDLDKIHGWASFKNTDLIYQNKLLHIDSVQIASSQEDVNRTFSLESELASLLIEGNFNYTTLIEDFTQLIYEYDLNFSNNEEKIKNYYSQKPKKQRPNYRLNYTVDLKNINPVARIFLDQIYISPNVVLEGHFQKGYTSILSFHTFVDTLLLGNSKYFNSEIDFTTSKIADSTNVLAMGYLFSKNQKLYGLADTKNLLVEGVWDNTHIDFRGDIQQAQANNYINLSGSLHFLANSIDIIFDQANINMLDKKWNISPENKIKIKSEEVSFEHLEIFHQDQSFAIDGSLAKNKDSELHIVIQAFQIENLNSIIEEELYGVINGYVNIENGTNHFSLNGDLKVNELKINNFLVGDILGTANWDKDLGKVIMDYQVMRLNKRILSLKGFYSPFEKEEQIDLTAIFNEANLNIAEPFIGEYISQIDGLASGTIKISGRLDYPILRGRGSISKGKFKVNYLNTVYTFDGNIFFDDNEIGVRNLRLFDDSNNQAIVNGGVFHDGFKSFVIDVQATLNNFKVLNTNARDNSLYYGTAITSGSLNVFGAATNLMIKANATSRKGTRIFIPINSTSEVEHREYINFISFKDKGTKEEKQVLTEKIDLKGLQLDLDLDITTDAYCEIIFDIKAGDIIRGRGNGKLKLQINTNGEFNMFGDYEFVEGGYNFTLQGLVNKEFKIKPNSKISWFGDPYSGIMNIQASYNQLVSLRPLLGNIEDEMISNRPEINRRYMTKVLLDLNGELLSPDIDFNIVIENYPENVLELQNAVNAFKARIAVDEQELNRQVFSLLILKRLSQEDAFLADGRQAVGNSVSELLSNQLSYLLNQVNDNFEIDVDLSGFDEEAWRTFQLRLSYSFMDGRLRITRDGTFTNAHQQTDLASIAGDWSIEYLLTKDGKLRIKMYNRNNLNAISIDNATTNTTSGVSIMHLESFDKLKELLKKNKKQDTGLGSDDDDPDNDDESENLHPKVMDIISREEEQDNKSKRNKPE
jgi:hypothetical protein